MEFPLWRLRPEDAARIIIIEPLRPVEKHKFWYKRSMSLKGSSKKIDPDRLRGAQYKPRDEDMRRLAQAKPNHEGKLNSYWRRYFEEYADSYPRIMALIGPMLKDGKFYSQVEHVANPLGERERPPFEGMYSRDQYEQDILYFESARAVNRENFILGQQGEGPYVDGLIYLKVDNLLLAEIAHCAARLRVTSAILQARRLSKLKAQAKDDEHWQPIGTDEAVAFQFKHSGHTVRKVGLRNYEVLIG